jgi:hypothetical protein
MMPLLVQPIANEESANKSPVLWMPVSWNRSSSSSEWSASHRRLGRTSRRSHTFQSSIETPPWRPAGLLFGLGYPVYPKRWQGGGEGAPRPIAGAGGRCYAATWRLSPRPAGTARQKLHRTGGADGWRRSGLALRDDFEQCKLADKLFAVPVVTASPHGRPIRCTFIPSYFAPSLAITWDRNPWRSRALQASARP